MLRECSAARSGFSDRDAHGVESGHRCGAKDI
jgi:hypothetical protein